MAAAAREEQEAVAAEQRKRAYVAEARIAEVDSQLAAARAAAEEAADAADKEVGGLMVKLDAATAAQQTGAAQLTEVQEQLMGMRELAGEQREQLEGLRAELEGKERELARVARELEEKK